MAQELDAVQYYCINDNGVSNDRPFDPASAAARGTIM